MYMKATFLRGYCMIPIWTILILLGFHDGGSIPMAVGEKTGSMNCLGSFDLYFVLDSSRTVGKYNFQNQTVRFVQKVASHFISPKTRISFITFSKKAKVILTLTGDSVKINNGIERLKMVNADGGGTYVHYGFEKVNEQIKDFGLRTASIVIVLTDGAFHYKNHAIDRANKSRELGATVYVIGVSKFQMKDLHLVASKPEKDHVFQSSSYSALPDLIDSIVEKACIEITKASPDTVCAGESYSVKLYGRGFTKTSNLSTVTCSFLLEDKATKVTKPSHITDDTLYCPAPTLEKVESFAILQVSVNGKSFISSNITVVGRNCTPVKVNHTPTVVGFLIVLTIIGLCLCWWFWKLLPCAKKEKPAASAQPPKKKWKTVDASFYGGGGVGGVKPVRVQWGDKGATDSGKKLKATKDAKVLESGSDPDIRGPKPFRVTLRERLAALLVWIRGKYHGISAYRPRQGGRNKLFTSRSEGYTRARNAQLSTSSQMEAV